jgi:hypothetical protein
MTDQSQQLPSRFSSDDEPPSRLRKQRKDKPTDPKKSTLRQAASFVMSPLRKHERAEDTSERYSGSRDGSPSPRQISRRLSTYSDQVSAVRSPREGYSQQGNASETSLVPELPGTPGTPGTPKMSRRVSYALSTAASSAAASTTSLLSTRNRRPSNNTISSVQSLRSASCLDLVGSRSSIPTLDRYVALPSTEKQMIALILTTR